MLRIFAILLLALLASCSSQRTTYPLPQHQTSTSLPTSSATIPAVPDNLSQAIASLPSSSSEHTRYLLNWSEQYLAADKNNNARALLNVADPLQLQPDQRLRWTFLMAQVELADQQPAAALALINDNRTLLSQAPEATQARFQLLSADIALLNGQPMDSLSQRVAVDRKLSSEDRNYNEQLIWTLLMQIPMPQLTSSLDTSQQDLQGWVELASIYRNPVASLAQQVKQVATWRRQWSGHPAASNLPPAIQTLQTASNKQPEKVVVLLPLSGPLAKAGKAIHDGLISGHFLALSQSATATEFEFIDTNGHQDIAPLYQQAVQQGAQMVLGPLQKNLVDQLRQLDYFPVPVLTFNYSNEDTQIDPNVIQYALRPEDQVHQIATQLWSEGKRQAGMLYPDSDWGQRLATAFKNQWQALGGRVVGQQTYSEQGSKSVPALLLTDESYHRRRQVGRYTNTVVQFNERPRQDMDFIFLVADPAQARQIKPLLNFHFASQLPVVSLSYIYRGHANAIKDKDLNGIRFLDTPWVLDTSDPQRITIDSIWDKGHGAYQSLFAMGLDGYRLIGRLPLLRASTAIGIPGKTGTLRLDNKNRIHLKYNWATFKRGLAVATPVVTQSD